MIKVYHVVAPHFVNIFLPIVAARAVNVHGECHRVFSPTQVLRMLIQIRQHNANEVGLSECFIQVKSIMAYQLPLTSPKTVIITFEVPMTFLTVGGTSSPDEAYVEVLWYLQQLITRRLSPGC
jgi:hypothetical protein